MPGRSSGQDKEAVVQGPERRTLGEGQPQASPRSGRLHRLRGLGRLRQAARWWERARRLGIGCPGLGMASLPGRGGM